MHNFNFKKGYIDDAAIVKESPNIKEDAFDGLTEESKKMVLEKFEIVDNFWNAIIQKKK